MYTTYFGLKEKPFRLVPDPEFLFLSASHEEALAHLSYAVSQQEGFAEVTGEVGTGKTTLCRSFLEEVGPDVETAFIFNSKLDARQLVSAILTELAIECESDDTADMTQALYAFLLEKRSLGKTVVLLIDEAQNLSRETLEQLRLLSNFETTRNKLLQIILVGQPELSDLLNSHDMRQLRQRINLSCHIRPLSLEETRQYISHRVNRASVYARSLFSSGAVRQIFRYSKGTPRLINILCDRALVAAFSLDKKEVTQNLVKTAYKEVGATEGKGRSYLKGHKAEQAPALWALAFAIGLILFLVFFFSSPPPKNTESDPADMNPGVAQGPLSEKSGWSGADLEKGGGNGTLRGSALDQAPVPGIKQGLSAPLEALSGNNVQAETEPVAQPSELPGPQAFPLISTADQIRSFLVQSASASAASREKALSLVLSLWGKDVDAGTLGSGFQDPDIEDGRYFEIRAMQQQLKVLHLQGHKDQIKLFNLPAILPFSVDGYAGFLAVIRLEDENICAVAGRDARHGIRVNLETLSPFLGQDIFVVWKDVFGGGGLISPASAPAVVISLKLALRQIGFKEIAPTAAYDRPVINAVKTIQARYGLDSDGLVGPMTKIVLFRELETARHARDKSVESSGLSSRAMVN